MYFWNLRRPHNKDKEMVKNTIEKNSLRMPFRSGKK